MRELQQILAALRTAPSEGKACATLVAVDQSAFRVPGARVTRGEDGVAIGSITAGCLESDIGELLDRTGPSHPWTLKAYVTGSGEDSLWGGGSGCPGRLWVSFAWLADARGWAGAVTEAFARGHDVVCLHRLQYEGATGEPGWVGAYDPLGPIWRGQTGAVPDAGLLAAIDRAWSRGRSEILPSSAGDDTPGWLVEYIRRPQRLTICGQGPDAICLAQLGSMMGWNVSLAPWGSALPPELRLPPGLHILHTPTPDDLRTHVSADERTAVVLMNHRFDRDLAQLAALAESRTGYFGLIGPRPRTTELMRLIGNDSEATRQSLLARLDTPAGLDLGGDTPESVALAIASAIQLAAHGRDGRPLNQRERPIHDR